MIRKAINKNLLHIIFIEKNRVLFFIDDLLENGWIRDENEPDIDGARFTKQGKNWTALILEHPQNFGISFKHDCNLGYREITEEQQEIEKEQEQGIYRINVRVRNIENNRTALFTRSICPMWVMDGDYQEGTYEDNGEPVSRSISWPDRTWEDVN